MHKSFHPVVLAIIKNGDKYLLTLRNEVDRPHGIFNGFWQLPGGGVEFGESVEEALIREAKEELSLDVSIIRLIPKIFHATRNNNWHGLFICFLCIMKDEASPIILNNEASEWSWFTKEEIVKLKKLDGIDEMIDAAF